MSIINEAHTDNQELDNVLEFEDMKDRFCPDYNPEEMAVVPRIGQRSRVKKLKLRSGISSTSTMTPRIFWEDNEDTFTADHETLLVSLSNPTPVACGESFRLRGGSGGTLVAASTASQEGPSTSTGSSTGVIVKFQGLPNKKDTRPGAFLGKCPARLKCPMCDYETLFELLYKKVNDEYCRDPDCCPPDKQVSGVCPRRNPPCARQNMPCSRQNNSCSRQNNPCSRQNQPNRDLIRSICQQKLEELAGCGQSACQNTRQQRLNESPWQPPTPSCPPPACPVSPPTCFMNVRDFYANLHNFYEEILGDVTEVLTDAAERCQPTEEECEEEEIDTCDPCAGDQSDAENENLEGYGTCRR